MVRILTKGGTSSFSDTHADWDESESLVDPNVAFYDFSDLQHRNHEFAYPTFDKLSAGDDTKNPVKLPDTESVWDYLKAGNDIVIRLPTESELKLEGRDHDGEEQWYAFNPFAWLPIQVEIDDRNEGRYIEPVDEWEWYFGDEFFWETVLQVGSAFKGRGSGYFDPRPPANHQSPETRASPNRGERYPRPNVESVAENNIGGTIAAKVTPQMGPFGSRGYTELDGSIFLIPPSKRMDFSTFVPRVAVHIYGADIEEKPDWEYDYPIPGEQVFRDRIKELESQIEELEEDIERAKDFREILFRSDDELEQLVCDIFREIGFVVEGEREGMWDGAIRLENSTIIMEITGQNDGIGHGKIHQLADHVTTAEKKNFGENPRGLLVFNHFRERDPVDRVLSTNNFKNKLEERNIQLITTVELYKLYSDFASEKTSKGEIATLLTSGDSTITTDTDLEKSTTPTASRVNSLRDWLSSLL